MSAEMPQNTLDRWKEMQAELERRADQINRLMENLRRCENTAIINLKVATDRGAEIERLRAALKLIANLDTHQSDLLEAQNYARAELDGAPEQKARSDG